jgi:hypothetical protein
MNNHNRQIRIKKQNRKTNKFQPNLQSPKKKTGHTKEIYNPKTHFRFTLIIDDV